MKFLMKSIYWLFCCLVVISFSIISAIGWSRAESVYALPIEIDNVNQTNYLSELLSSTSSTFYRNGHHHNLENPHSLLSLFDELDQIELSDKYNDVKLSSYWHSQDQFCEYQLLSSSDRYCSYCYCHFNQQDSTYVSYSSGSLALKSGIVFVGVSSAALKIPFIRGYANIALVLSSIGIGAWSFYRNLSNYYQLLQSSLENQRFLGHVNNPQPSDSNASNHYRPTRYFSSSHSSQSFSDKNPNNPNIPPLIIDQDQNKHSQIDKTSNHKDNPQIKKIVRKARSSKDSEYSQRSYFSLMYDHKITYGDDIWFFDYYFSKNSDYQFTIKDHLNDSIPELVLPFVRKLSLIFFEDINFNKVIERIAFLQKTYQYYPSSSLRSVDKKLFQVWFLKNYQKTDLAIALKVITDYKISDQEFAKLLAISVEDLNQQTHKVISAIIDFFRDDFLSNIEKIEDLSDYLMIQFACVRKEVLKHKIKAKFIHNPSNRSFYKAVLFFISYYDLDHYDIVLFLSKTIGINNNKNTKLHQYIDQMFHQAGFDHQYINDKHYLMLQAFEQLLSSRKNQIFTQVSFLHYLKVIEAQDYFEKLVALNKYIRFSFKNGGSLWYNTEFAISNRLKLIIKDFKEHHPMVFSQVEDDKLKIILYLESNTSFQYTEFISRYFNMSLDKFISARTKLLEYYYDVGKIYGVDNYPTKGHLLKLQPNQLINLINDLIIFDRVALIEDSFFIRKVLLDYYGSLESPLYQDIFLLFVLKLQQPSFMSLQSLITKYKNDYPQLIINNSVFDRNNFFSQPKAPIVEMIEKVTTDFIAYFGKSVEASSLHKVKS